MSAVTLNEIADLAAARLKVPVAAMRGINRGHPVGVAEDRARRARNVVIVLARRHTQASFRELLAFFTLQTSGSAIDRMRLLVSREAEWRGDDGELDAAIEEIERQIDALHERRMAQRDSHGRVRA
jgi:hypothetical protein